MNLSEENIRQQCAKSVVRSGGALNVEGLSVAEILREIETCADQPLKKAQTLPAEAYTSQAFFDWETEHVFKHEWLCLGHVSQIPKAGDFMNHELLGEPLAVVHGKDGGINMLSRICPHRAMDILPEGFEHKGHSQVDPSCNEPRACGHTRIFMCPYHSWTFDLDGRLKGCPEMGQAEGFCRESHPLTVFRSEVWQGFIFVNLDGKAEKSVNAQYESFGQDIAPWKMAEMKIAIETEWDCPFNWKVMIENFMESYHHAGAHAKTLQQTMPAKDTWTESEKAHYIRCHLPFKASTQAEITEKESAGELAYIFPPVEGLTEAQRNEWGLYLGYPNFMYVVGADCAVWYRLLPIGPEQFKLITTVMVPPSTLEHPDYAEMRKEGVKMAVDFHLEDMHACINVQKGFHSAAYKRGRLSHLEMPIWLIQRYLAARSRGSWPTVDRPAAEGQTHSL
jgi:phenylpropionate dioxygenase-like ring-hydroxylating dioxygenase large terminal subunit